MAHALVSLTVFAAALAAGSARGQDVFVQINDDIASFCVPHGNGDPIVFIHGALSDHTFWGQHLAAFADEGFRAISYSRRHNFPNNNQPDEEHSAVVESRDLLGLLDQLEIDQAHIIGHSYGAYTGLLFALDHPERVRTLTVCEPPLVPWLDEVEGELAAEAAARKRALLDQMLPSVRAAFADGDADRALRAFMDVVAGKGSLDSMPRFVVQIFHRNAGELKALSNSATPYPPVSKKLVSECKVPTLIMSGGNSNATSKFTDDELQRLLPAASRVVIDDATHALWPERPVDCQRAVLQFIRAN